MVEKKTSFSSHPDHTDTKPIHRANAAFKKPPFLQLGVGIPAQAQSLWLRRPLNASISRLNLQDNQDHNMPERPSPYLEAPGLRRGPVSAGEAGGEQQGRGQPGEGNKVDTPEQDLGLQPLTQNRVGLLLHLAFLVKGPFCFLQSHSAFLAVTTEWV